MTSEGESLSRTQDPQSTRHRVRPRRNDTARIQSFPRHHAIEVVEEGRRYCWGRRGDAYFVWDKRKPGESLGHSGEAGARREYRWLEQEAQIRRRRRRTRLLIAAGLICVAAAPTAIVMYVNGSSSPSRADVGHTAGPERYVNAEGGYGFRVPTGWNVRTSASTTQVTSPNDDIAISILVAPQGDIDAVSDASIESIAATWTDTKIEASQPRTVGDLPALSVGGTAVDDSGTPIRFLSIVIDSGTRNHAIWVSVPEAYDAATFLPSIDQILTTFRLLGEA